MSQLDLFFSSSSVTPLPPIPVEVPAPGSPEPKEPNIEEPVPPDEDPFPRVVPQPIATPEE